MVRSLNIIACTIILCAPLAAYAAQDASGAASGLSVWQVVVSLFQGLSTILMGLFVWMLKRSLLNAERLSRLEQKLEQLPQHVPSEEHIIRIHDRIDSVEKDLGKMLGSTASTAQIVSTIHEYLLNHGRGK